MADSLDSADAPLMVAAVRKKRGPGQRLTLADRYKILVLHRTHPTWSTRQLAEAAGVSHETARLTVIAASRGPLGGLAPLVDHRLGQCGHQLGGVLPGCNHSQPGSFV